MSAEFYTVCNDKDILLQKNDDDNYIINMTIQPNKNNSFTLIDIITELELWNLLYELNNDNIEEYKLTNINQKQDVFIKVKSTTEKQISNELKDIIIHIQTTHKLISDNECNIVCTNLTPSTIIFNNFIINVLCSQELTYVTINFTLEDINDLISTYIALYIKKIFYRLSKYLS
jgi:hypothetical protein